jgi:UDP-GlcNAc:undecaprenyl-phosphate GlcNAc-1-phosphate transferase
MTTRVSFQMMNGGLVAGTDRDRRVLVYGAGGYGRLLVREMRANSAWRMNPVGFIDDDPLKAHRWIVGVPVHGAIDQLEQVMRAYKVDEVLLSSPAINGNVEVRIREVCIMLERPVRRLRMEIT